MFDLLRACIGTARDWCQSIRLRSWYPCPVVRKEKQFLPSDSRRFSASELALARLVSANAVRAVERRQQYLDANGVNPAFAFPSANWSYDAPNAFVQLFTKIAPCDAEAVNSLRAYCQPFSGYDLYELSVAREGSPNNTRLPSDMDALVSVRIEERNLRYVERWKTMIAGLPARCLFSPPHMFGEIGHDIGGIVVNHDTVAYQERVNILFEAGVVDWLDRMVEERGEVRILEIGAGYGALAFWFKQAYPHCSYTIIDLPECLLFSGLYISLARPDVATSWGLSPARFGVRFCPNYMAEALAEPFDLVVNTLSMSEMSEVQVKRYVELMKTHWVTEGGLFFEQNQDNRHMGLLCAQEIFAEQFPQRVIPQVKCVPKLQNGMPNIWSLKGISLHRPPLVSHKPERPELLEDLGEFNLVRAGNVFWALHKSLGPTDPFKLAVRDDPPLIFFGSCPDEIKEKLSCTP